jgi:small subunit ribosomal protein S13
LAKKGKKPIKKAEKPAKGEKKKAPSRKKEEVMEPGLRGIVRIAGKDMKGNLPLPRALLRVRGFGHTMRHVAANAISKELNIPKTEKVGKLTDEQIEKIDALLTELHTKGMPSFLLNRKRDPDTGKDVHVIMNDLAFSQRQDIEREKKLYTWKGYRHAYGKKVRGQRTRNTGRKGMALGVMRRAVLAATGGKGAGAGEAQAAKEAKK